MVFLIFGLVYFMVGYPNHPWDYIGSLHVDKRWYSYAMGSPLLFVRGFVVNNIYRKVEEEIVRTLILLGHAWVFRERTLTIPILGPVLSRLSHFWGKYDPSILTRWLHLTVSQHSKGDWYWTFQFFWLDCFWLEQCFIHFYPCYNKWGTTRQWG